MENIYIVSTDKRIVNCPYCNYETDRKNNLKRHIVTMHYDSSKILECCGDMFKSKASLREHVAMYHKTGYRCHVCSRNFCRKALLRRHLTVHSGEKDFRCPDCQYATSHKSNLERHQKIHFKVGDLSSSGTNIIHTSRPNTKDSSDSSNYKKKDKGRVTSAFDCNRKFSSHRRTENRIVWRYHSLFLNRKNMIEKPNVNNNDSKITRNKTFKDNNSSSTLETINGATNLLKLESDKISQLSTDGTNNNKYKLEENKKLYSSLHGTPNRMWLCPYKCNECKTWFSTQYDQEQHGCHTNPITDLTIPITCIVQKKMTVLADNLQDQYGVHQDH